MIHQISMLQCDALVAEGAVLASSPADMVQQCDITFAMLADPDAALKVGESHNRLPGSNQHPKWLQNRV
jgi:3-hydroxyisobutyrate dehydrogenase-like beta-hydroxyacid dehydrogenase